MLDDIIVYLFTALFLSLILLIPFTVVGIEYLYKFYRHGKFETKKYKYWREKKNA